MPVSLESGRSGSGERARICGSIHVALKSNLIISEANRLLTGEATTLDAETARYLRTGNGNWQTAMYIRAFPGLLGVLAPPSEPSSSPPTCSG